MTKHIRPNPLSQKEIELFQRRIEVLRRHMIEGIADADPDDRYEVACEFGTGIMALYQAMNPHIEPEILSWGDLAHLKPTDAKKSAFVRVFNGRKYSNDNK